MLAALTVLLLSAEPLALTSAREHLKAGRIDDVLFDLQDQKVPEEHRTAAADVLAQAASKSASANDDLLALQLAQMALRHAPKHGLAHEIAARASLSHGPTSAEGSSAVGTSQNSKRR